MGLKLLRKAIFKLYGLTNKGKDVLKRGEKRLCFAWTKFIMILKDFSSLKL